MRPNELIAVRSNAQNLGRWVILLLVKAHLAIRIHRCGIVRIDTHQNVNVLRRQNEVSFLAVVHLFRLRVVSCHLSYDVTALSHNVHRPVDVLVTRRRNIYG
jgi:hypothetical protein